MQMRIAVKQKQFPTNKISLIFRRVPLWASVHSAPLERRHRQTEPSAIALAADVDISRPKFAVHRQMEEWPIDIGPSHPPTNIDAIDGSLTFVADVDDAESNALDFNNPNERKAPICQQSSNDSSPQIHRNHEGRRRGNLPVENDPLGANFRETIDKSAV